jgi:hypothetical protein
MILFESLRVSKSVEICMFLVSGWTLLHWCWPLVISTGVHQLSTQGVSSGVFTSWVGVFSGEYWRIYFDVLKVVVGDIWLSDGFQNYIDLHNSFWVIDGFQICWDLHVSCISLNSTVSVLTDSFLSIGVHISTFDSMSCF